MYIYIAAIDGAAQARRPADAHLCVYVCVYVSVCMYTYICKVHIHVSEAHPVAAQQQIVETATT